MLWILKDIWVSEQSIYDKQHFVYSPNWVKSSKKRWEIITVTPQYTYQFSNTSTCAWSTTLCQVSSHDNDGNTRLLDHLYGIMLTLPIHWIQWTMTLRPENPKNTKVQKSVHWIFIIPLSLIAVALLWCIAASTWLFVITIIEWGTSLASFSIYGLTVFFFGILLVMCYRLVFILYPQKITTILEDVLFENKYVVYPKTWLTSRIFLTPERMSILTRLRDRWTIDNTFSLHIEDSTLYLHFTLWNNPRFKKEYTSEAVIRKTIEKWIFILQELNIHQYI